MLRSLAIKHFFYAPDSEDQPETASRFDHNRTASLFVLSQDGQMVKTLPWLISGQFGLRFHLPQIALNEVFPLMLSGVAVAF